MKKRFLGQSSLEVSAIGFGTMNMGREDKERTREEDEKMIRIIRQAYEDGVTLFDTAEVYTNEKLVGEALEPFREDIVLATKFGISMSDGEQIVDANPEGIRKSLEGSLKKLRTDYVDLYYLHRVDINTPIEVVAETMKELHKEGKIKHWGISEPGVETLRRAHKVFPVTAVQSEYSMMYREREEDLFPVLEELGIGFVPFSPLAKGFLTDATDGAYLSQANSNTRFSKKNLENNLALKKLVVQFAEEKEVSAAQISLAWVIAQKPWIVPIPGTTKMHRMKENVAAASVDLTEDELKQLKEALDKVQIAGSRYEPGSEFEKRVGI